MSPICPLLWRTARARNLSLVVVALLGLTTSRALCSDLPRRAAETQPTSQDSPPVARETRTSPDADLIEAQYRHVRDTYAPMLVTIKFVQKTQGRFGEFEGENEINGVMIEPTGLVLCSNMLLGGSASRRAGGRSVPSEIKVLIGDDLQGLDARFVARDTELDLAWLQIKEPGERKFAALDLEAALKAPVTPRLGQRVLTLGVMGRYFGQEVLVSEGLVAGRTRKPRELYVLRGAVDTDPGLPVFTPAGQLLGFACVQQPDADEVSGNVANLTARGRGLILPVRTVVKATEQAKAVRQEDVEEDTAPSPPDPDEDGNDDRAEP